MQKLLFIVIKLVPQNRQIIILNYGAFPVINSAQVSNFCAIFWGLVSCRFDE